MSDLGKQLAVMSQGSVITRPAGCSFLHLGQPCSSFVFIYVFVHFPSCGKCNKSSFVFLFFLKREEKQGSENGCNVGPFIMVSKMHSKEPLTFCFYGMLVYIMHFSLTVHIWGPGKQGAMQKQHIRLAGWVIDFSMNHLKSLSLTEHKHTAVDIKNSGLVHLHQSLKGDVETLTWHTGWKLFLQPSELCLTTTWSRALGGVFVNGRRQIERWLDKLHKALKDSALLHPTPAF